MAERLRPIHRIIYELTSRKQATTPDQGRIEKFFSARSVVARKWAGFSYKALDSRELDEQGQVGSDSKACREVLEADYRWQLVP